MAEPKHNLGSLNSSIAGKLKFYNHANQQGNKIIIYDY